MLIGVVLLGAGVLYLFTVAPTLSFWDCGEFISSAYTLAIPHPPGTPLYVFAGRVWLMVLGLIAAILPISKEVAWHMNLLAIFFSLGSVYLLYIMIIKILSFTRTGVNRTGIWSAFIATLGVPFYYTVWQNAVETEVYAPASFVFILINYLVILWYEKIKKNQIDNRYLLLIFYLIFLATGIHLVPFLSLIPIYVFILFVKPGLVSDKFFVLIGVFQVIVFAYMFLLPDALLAPALILIFVVIGLGIVFSLTEARKGGGRLFFWMGLILVLIGLSTELYLPLRSRKLTEMYQDSVIRERYLNGENIAPRINMNEPGASLSAFFGVLHRSQYGAQRIIPRQTQVQGIDLLQGIYHQIGLYIRYLSQQVAPEHLNTVLRILILLVFYCLIIYGMYELYSRERLIFLLLILMFFSVSIGVVGYLNLKFSPSDSNPTHQPREVRERDYFFHTSFLYAGILISFGLLGIFERLRKMSFTVLISAGSLLFSIMPVFSNFSLVSRYKNFIPRDYGYNLLMSCAPNSIVFTNGDNDTFPLWFVQEVLGIRRDVIVANLSLINTDWYIRHLKHWGVPISLDTMTIKKLCNQGYFITPDKRVMLVKDILIRDILASNAGRSLSSNDYFVKSEEFGHKYLNGYKGKIPVYFSSTVDSDNYRGFDPYIKIEGIVYRVTGDSVSFPKNLDIKKTQELFYETYRYTGFFAPAKYEQLSRILRNFNERKKTEFFGYETLKDQNTFGLYFNYGIALIYLGFSLRDNNDYQGALDAWRLSLMFECLDRETWKLHYNLGMLFNQLQLSDSADAYFRRIDIKEPQIYTQIGESFRNSGDFKRALDYFQEALRINPRNASSYMGLIVTYLDMKDTSSAVRILQDWLKFNPYDTSAQMMLRSLEKSQ